MSVLSCLKMSVLTSFLLFVLLSFPFVSTAKDSLQRELESVQLALISPHTQVKKEESFLVGIKIKIPQGWHSYWSFAGDFGQSPVIQWKPIENIIIQSLPFPLPERKPFFIGEKQAYSFVYEKELLIPFEIFIDKNYESNHLLLSLDLKWFVCKEVCVSKENRLSLDLKFGDAFQENGESKKVFNVWNRLFPKDLNLKSHFRVKNNKLIVHFSFREEIQCLDLFPNGKEHFSTTLPVLLNQGLNSCSFELEKSSSELPKISGLFVYSKQEEKQSAVFQSYRQKGFNLLWFVFMAFLGGLLLNIMPCVLPIIFLKFYNTLELKHLSSGKILLLNLSYTLGVIVSFLFLAFVIFISKQTGESLGWGFHLQSPIFVTSLALLFALMGFYFLNIVSFSVPKVSLFFKDEKVFSHFITGILSTTAASPCTVPFMTSAVGFAFSRSYIEIFVIFFFLGLGLSFPYLVLSFFPKALKYVPSPGRWTEILKQLLSIPLFLTVLWLMRILYLQLELKVFLFSLMIFPLLFIWIIFQKAITKNTVKYGSTFIFLILTVGLLIFQKAFLNSLQKKPSQNRTKIIRDLHWMAFDANQILFDKQAGQNVFVAFGAEWCLTCKLNERIFQTREFKDVVRQNQIRIYYGDWTSKTSDITHFLESYAQQGVPFYVFFKGEEKVFIFPTLLLKESFMKKIKELSE